MSPAPTPSRIPALQALLDQRPGDVFLRYAIALEKAREGNPEAAIAELETLSKEHPDYVGAYYQLGRLFEQRGLEDRAIAAYRRGIPVAEKLGDTHALGELNQALALLEDEP